MPFTMLKPTIIASIVIALSACGGGGQSSAPTSVQASSSNLTSTASSVSSDINKNKITQNISFAHNEYISINEGGSYLNPAVAKGTGVISYVSSDTKVATVDGNGLVQTIADVCTYNSEVTITASITADEKYAAASSSYTIHLNQMVTTADILPLPRFEKASLFLSTSETNVNPLMWFTGTATYTSSDTSIVSVSNTGEITALKPGTAVITAEMLFTPTCGEPYTHIISYTVTVTDKITLAPQDISFYAWVGANNALFTFPESANGFTFFSSSNKDCDFSDVANCANGQFVQLNGATITDTATTLNQFGYYELKDSNNHSSFRMLSNTTFSPRAEHQVVTFNNTLMLVGGYLGMQNFESPELKNDAWSSTDGITWTEQTEQAGFSPRTGHKVVNFNNALWLIGGNDRTVDYLIPGDDNGRKNDIWSSADGVIWTQQISKASFSPRTGHEVVSFNNKLWVIGGDDKNGLKNDVWSSTNGITWIRQTANANFSPRADHQVVVYNNKLWLIGGSGNNDVWSSTDGVNWIQQTANANFEARNGYQVAVHANKLWMIGGYNNNGYKNDVWSSTDGITWTQQTEHAAFEPCANAQLISFNNKLILIGGYTQTGFSNDIWSSTDGIEWRKGFSGTFQFPQ